MNDCPKKIKLMIVFGTRPEAIKLIPLIKELNRAADFDCFVCATGQHRDLVDQVLRFFDITPDQDLDLMRDNQGLNTIFSRLMLELPSVIQETRPDWLVVQGDTTTAFATALAGYYNNIKVAHVEAGLRTGDIRSPWPEEGNRKLISAITGLHLTPTEASRENLLREGVNESQIKITGNTVIDALFMATERMKTNPAILNELESRFNFLDRSKRLVLTTNHRRESFGQGMTNICEALRDIAGLDNVEILFPVHPNPQVKECAFRLLGGVSNVHLVEPLEYSSFIYAMNRAYFLISDSGGVQEEAPALGKPVLVTRFATERSEGIETDCARLVGAERNGIYKQAKLLLEDTKEYERMSKSRNLYGDGLASQRIVQALREFNGGPHG